MEWFAHRLDAVFIHGGRDFGFREEDHILRVYRVILRTIISFTYLPSPFLGFDGRVPSTVAYIPV